MRSENLEIWENELLFGRGKKLSTYERDMLLAELKHIILNGGDVQRAKIIQERLKNDFSEN